MSASPKPYDQDVARLRRAGHSYEEIGNTLGITKWAVGDALSRLGMRERPKHFHKIITYKKRPLVEKTCPVCRRKHMSDPVIWTCPQCKAAQGECDD